jgi:hypothetical protein
MHLFTTTLPFGVLAVLASLTTAPAYAEPHAGRERACRCPPPGESALLGCAAAAGPASPRAIEVRLISCARALASSVLIEPLQDMPEGTIGFRATGRVTRDEYRDVLLGPMRDAAEAGDVRMVFAIGPGFEKFEIGALAQDTKSGVTLGLGHPHAWKRTALVTDVDWIAKALHMFAWLTPGEVRLYQPDELQDAKQWVAE